jgi:hypothetical protein
VEESAEVEEGAKLSRRVACVAAVGVSSSEGCGVTCTRAGELNADADAEAVRR